MNEELLRYNKKAVFCFMDCESEDLSTTMTNPWQWGLMVANFDGILRAHNLFIQWPDINMTADLAKKIHFNKEEWRRKAISVNEAFDIIDKEFSSCDWVVGYNSLNFDNPIYHHASLRAGRKPLKMHNKTLDIFPLFKGVKLGCPFKKDMNLLQYQTRMLHHVIKQRGFATLSAAAKYYDIKFEEESLHDALADVRLLMEVFKKIVWDVEI